MLELEHWSDTGEHLVLSITVLAGCFGQAEYYSRRLPWVSFYYALDYEVFVLPYLLTLPAGVEVERLRPICRRA